jgi:hypothetical protein
MSQDIEKATDPFCHSCPDFHRDKLQQESRNTDFRVMDSRSPPSRGQVSRE